MNVISLLAAALLLWPTATSLLVPGPAAAAEFETTDRLLVNGTAVFRSSSTFEKQLAVGTSVITSSLTVQGGIFVSTSASAEALFYVNSSTGLVGVGTSSPGEHLHVNGNIRAVRFIGDGKYITGVEGVPIGTIALFDGACPTNWSEYSPGQGRFIVSNVSGGTIAGTLGSAFANLADAAYTPAGTNSAPAFTGNAGTTGAEAAHAHNMPHTHTTDVALFTSGAGASHNHPYTSGGPSATSRLDVVTTAAGGTLVPTSDHTQSGTVSNEASHTNSVDPAATASGNPSIAATAAGTGHSQSFTPAGTVAAPVFSGAANSAMRSVIAPYIQLRLCQKTVGMGTAGGGWDDSGSYVFPLSTDDFIGIGTQSPAAKLTIGGGALQVNATASPGVSGAATGRIYFDSTQNKFYVSEDGGAYVYLVGASGLQGSGNSGRIPKFNTSTSLTDSVLYEASSKISIGRAPGAAGAAKLELYGTDVSVAGPHLQAVTSLDNYPVAQYLNWGHDNISLTMDGYFDGNWRSSDAGSNYQLRKISDAFFFSYASGAGQGSVTTWNTGVKLDASGRLGVGASLDTTVKTHVNGKLRVDDSTVSVNGTNMYLIPSGAMAFFDGSACPAGWNEVASVRSRAARGWDGSTAAGDSNTGGADSHTHTTDIASFTSGAGASHNHSYTSGGPGATSRLDVITTAANGTLVPTDAHTQSGTTSGEAAHTNALDPGSTASSSGSSVPAYRSILTCRKN